MKVLEIYRGSEDLRTKIQKRRKLQRVEPNFWYQRIQKKHKNKTYDEEINWYIELIHSLLQTRTLKVNIISHMSKVRDKYSIKELKN